MDSLVPARAALRPSVPQNSFRRRASSLPLSRPHGLCLWQILFGISQTPQIPIGSSRIKKHFARKNFDLLAMDSKLILEAARGMLAGPVCAELATGSVAGF
jgi:hypothetical protein